MRPVAWAFGAVAGTLALPAVLAIAVALVLARRVRRSERTASLPVAAASDVLGQDRTDAGPWPADAIVAFGATVDAEGPCAELRARLDHAAALWRMGVSPVVLVAGGVVDGIDEVTAMAAYLVEDGVGADAVAPVRPGDNTRLTLDTIRRLGYRRIVAVSSPYHAHRIEVEGHRQGLDVTVSTPRSTPETRHAPTYRARFASEVVAAVWYALPRWVAGRVRTGPGTLRHVAPQVLAGQAPPAKLLQRGTPGGGGARWGRGGRLGRRGCA